MDDWEDYITPYEFAYNNSVHPGLGDTPFFLSHGRHATMPVAVTQPTPSPQVDDFIQHLQNRIMAARDHLRLVQGDSADQRRHHTRHVVFSVGDLVLLSTTHYNLQLPSQKLSPRYLGPLKVLQIRGPNTVLIEVPPRLRRIQAIQNVHHLRPYISRPREIGPTNLPQIPDLVDGCEEYEVEEILAHRKAGARIEYLVRFATYGPEDDLWLPKRNLGNAAQILRDYHRRQEDESPHVTPRVRAQRAPRQLTRMGHLWYPTRE
jgi:hypothetical protein